jgi:hypothetical protein
MDDPNGTVTFEDVLYVSDGLVPIVEYQCKRFGMPFRLMEPGTSIRSVGDRGRVVMARVVAEWMELVPASPRFVG